MVGFRASALSRRLFLPVSPLLHLRKSGISGVKGPITLVTGMAEETKSLGLKKAI